jgi:hypothetical protein
MNCPYRDQHAFAESIEHLVADKLGVDWAEYGIALERAVDEKFQKKPKKFVQQRPTRNSRIAAIKDILSEAKE